MSRRHLLRHWTLRWIITYETKERKYLTTFGLPLPTMNELIIFIDRVSLECGSSTFSSWLHLGFTIWLSPSQSLYHKCVKDLVLFVWFLESFSSFLQLFLIHHLKNLCRDPAMLKWACQTDGRVWQKWICMSSWGASWETTPYQSSENPGTEMSSTH